MQSSIDQGPYLNVADGMVAAMGNEHTDEDEASVENKANDQTDQTVLVTENHVSSGRKPDFATNAGQAPEDSLGSKSSGIIQRCLNQLSRQSNKSIWLLAYIAVISSWPIVGAALGYLYRRKLKKGLLGGGPK